MSNPFQKHIIELFNRIIELRHSTSRINSILKNDITKYSTEDPIFISGSSLIISDWTGPTDNGWELNFHTGISKFTKAENYSKEVEKIISQECCLAFAQSFEALEKFLKNCYYEISLKNGNQVEREKIKGGKNLFKLIRKSCGEEYLKYTQENNKNIDFKEFWSTISETRHGVVHSSCKVKKTKIAKSKGHYNTFKYLFDFEDIPEEKILIKLNYKQLDKLLKQIAEFAYQILKMLSLKENLDYELR